MGPAHTPGLLDALPQGVVLLSGASRVLGVNRAARRILASGDGLGVQAGVLRAADGAECRDLHDLVASQGAANGSAPAKGGGEARRVSRPSGARPLELWVQPVGPNPPEPGARVALFVTDPEETIELPASRLRSLYGFTPTEARVAAKIAGGLSPESVGAAIGVQANTVRMHLKRIFAKTGTRRQSELVRLLLSGPARLGGD